MMLRNYFSISSFLTIAVLPLFAFFMFTPTSFGQVTQTEFGKNRVQYHKFKWFEYESDNFRTYWYGGGKQIGITAVQMAEWDYPKIQEILEHRINRKIEILVFNDLTDLKQSNIGNEETFVNTGGQTKIVENKIFVYFNGDHNHLRKQIREGIANVYMNNMMFGSNIQEVVQNAVLLNLPQWFSQGLVSYVGEKWSPELDNQLRDVFMSGKYKTFEEFSAANPKLAGHSLWYYIDSHYGLSTASSLIYLTRINRSVESGFLYVLGSPFNRVLMSWDEYFKDRYNSSPIKTVPSDSLKVNIRNKRKTPISQAKLSPNGKELAYAFNEDGKIKVFVHNLESDQRKMIFKTGSRNNIQATDYNYPLLSWSPDNQFLGIIYEKTDVVKFIQINPETKEKITQDFAPQYQRVYSMEYINSNDLLVSGSLKGFSDIFIYHINQRSSDPITRDFYDDLHPTIVQLDGEKGIMFSSNRGTALSPNSPRIDSIIPMGNFDIYYYPLGDEEVSELIQVTNTPYSNESYPMAIDERHYAFLSDYNGINNRYSGYLEEYISRIENVVVLKSGYELIFPEDSIPEIPLNKIDTTFLRPIKKWRGKNYPSTSFQMNIDQAYASFRHSKVVENIPSNGIDAIYISDKNSKEIGFRNSPYRQLLLKSKANELKKKKEYEEKEATPKEKPSTWEFDPGFGDIEETPQPKDIPDEPVVEEDPGFVFITDYLGEDDEPEVKSTTVVKPTPKDSIPDENEIIDIDNYQFESDFGTDETDAAVIVEDEDGRVTLQSPSISYAKDNFEKDERKVHRYIPNKVLTHRLKFKANSITTQIDNSLLFGGLDAYYGSPFEYPPVGIFLKSSVQDLFEDYELEGGIRVPTTFDGLEYYVTFKDEKKRLDKAYSYYRKSKNFSADSTSIFPIKARSVSNLVQADLRYPLDIYGSLRARAWVRNDKFHFLSTERATLEAPADVAQRIGLRLEYVYDNTIDIDLNLKHGTRLKVYSEVIKKMQISIQDEFKFNFNKGLLFLVGADIRHYQRLGKHTVFATRISGATSLGSEKMLIYLGGADNELFPSTNLDIPIPDVGNEFAYQTLASPLRGFKANIRNGNSFVLGNVELRFPLFKYFYKRPIRSNILRHFQIIGFFDVGTAWQGLSPFSEDNPLNTSVFSPPPGAPQVISAVVNYYRDPIVAGFGAGIRTKLFGYFIRVDYAKGIETKVIQPGTWHISLGTDF